MVSMEIGTVITENTGGSKLKTERACDSAILLLGKGKAPKGNEISISKTHLIPMFTAALLTIHKIWKQSEC